MKEMQGQAIPHENSCDSLSTDQAKSMRDILLRYPRTHRELPIGGDETGNPTLSAYVRDQLSEALTGEMYGRVAMPSALRRGQYLLDLAKIFVEHRAETNAALDAIELADSPLSVELAKRRLDDIRVGEFLAEALCNSDSIPEVDQELVAHGDL